MAFEKSYREHSHRKNGQLWCSQVTKSLLEEHEKCIFQSATVETIYRIAFIFITNRKRFFKIGGAFIITKRVEVL